MRVTHIGGPTALLEIGGWTILTDPTFDAPGRRYRFGWGTGSRKEAGPAIAAADLPPIDCVLLSHDQHADNLDDAGRALLVGVRTVLTTVSGARRVAHGAVGLRPWERVRIDHTGRPSLEIMATPARHGPPGSRPIVGEVIGFVLRWDGQRHGVVWISGDTVLFPGVEALARRVRVGTALLHLGNVRFGLTGRVRYTMSSGEAVRVCRMMAPHTMIPLHYEGWNHFREGREDVERAFLGTGADLHRHIHWLGLGIPTTITT